MTIVFPYGETVTVLRAVLVEDEYENQVRDWENATPTPYAGCAVAQNGRDESLTGDRNVIASDLIVFMPFGADVLATDRLEIRGRAYEVVGATFAWRSPFSGLAFGTVVYCNRVEG
ncbi:hypothetical protein AB0C44_07865 [Micromonospora taraxaci]|uniref:hypothetical protein n=1 Tax=Micromonospora taraxaci TaxID=1316803 RepID=UPI0033C9B99E